MSPVSPALLKTFYFITITLAAIYCFKRPLYNWDMLPYTDLVLRMDHSSADEAYYQTYQLTARNIPARYYHALTDSSNDYRYELAKNPRAFDEQLPYYVVKPLYLGMIYLAYDLGVSLPEATLVPSFVCYLLVAYLLLLWLSVYVRLPVAVIIAALMMLSSPVIEVAKSASPDLLSALLLFCSFYFVLEKPSLRAASVFMMLAILARLDNMLACTGLLALIYGSGKWSKKISLGSFLIVGVLFTCCYLLNGLFAYRFGWSVFYYNDFADHLHPRYGSTQHFSLSSYFRLMYEHLLGGLNRSFLAVFMLLLAMNFTERFAWRSLSFDRTTLLFIPVVLLARFLLYPDISDRFYIPFYLLIVVLTAKRYDRVHVDPLRKGTG